jgi:orotate phosphoribosyltransferase
MACLSWCGTGQILYRRLLLQVTEIKKEILIAYIVLVRCFKIGFETPHNKTKYSISEQQFTSIRKSRAMTAQLPQYKQDFLQAAISGGALKFGSFELKSKRISPYFFNAGEFHSARLAGAISTAFAHTIIAAQKEIGLDFDVVFGPAYKGIPLSSAITVKLGELAPQNLDRVSYSFDRKEAKDHGEGGNIVGAPLKGKKVLIVDDVITAGTAKREAIEKITKEGGKVVGIVVALDRKEKLPATDGDDFKPGPSAIGELKKEYGFPIFAILTLDDIIEGMKTFANEEQIRQTEEYRQKYKASD